MLWRVVRWFVIVVRRSVSHSHCCVVAVDGGSGSRSFCQLVPAAATATAAATAPTAAAKGVIPNRSILFVNNNPTGKHAMPMHERIPSSILSKTLTTEFGDAS